jgi:hypothetical protein
MREQKRLEAELAAAKKEAEEINSPPVVEPEESKA